MQARISKLILEINGKRIELTEEEAKSLKDKLNELFEGKDVIYIPYEVEKEHTYINPYVHPYPYWTSVYTTTTTDCTTVNPDTITLTYNSHT